MAKKDDILQKLRGLLPEGSISEDDSFQAGVAASVRMDLGRLREVAEAFRDAGFYLETLTALDFEDTAELVYHFNAYEPSARIALRTLCGHDQAAPTLCDIHPTAEWLEREVREFYGISFPDNPDQRPLLLPEDADYYPLKKTFGTVHAYRRREEIYG